MGKTRVIRCDDETVPRWMKEQGVTGGWLTGIFDAAVSTQPRKIH
jgi:hypothetical protein